jgi:hypothetical protein
MEQQKKSQYGERIIQVQQGTFTPLVFSSLGMGKEAQTFVKKLATLLSEKNKEQYSQVICLLRARIAFAFALWRCANECLRGTRRPRNHLPPLRSLPTDVINFQLNIYIIF